MEVLTTLASSAAVEAIKTLAKDMSCFVTKKVSEYYTDITNKELVDSGWAFEDYLSRTYNEFYKSKSILYTNEARILSSFFVPSFLKFETEIFTGKVNLTKKHYKLSAEDIEALLRDSTKIVITGIGGLGKTMHMRHFCINSVEKKCKIPVFISLRAFNDYQIGEKSFEELVYDRLTIFGFKLKYEYFKYSLESDKYLFLLDGYDEISSSKRNQISTKLQDFTQRYSGNCFIISSREIEDVYSWDNFKIFSLCPLEPRQSVQLIWKLDFSYEIKKSFIDEINSQKFSKYEFFISVPLLLSILFLTYADNLIIPETLQAFYERAFDTMLYRHDRLEKSGYIRELESGISYEEYRSIFVYFCYISYFQDRYSFSERSIIDFIVLAAKKSKIKIDPHKFKNDLIEATCMLYKDGRDYTFIHRSFQEYFAALYVSKKSDIEQCGFCSSYLDMNKFQNRTGKAYDFFSMLYAIEPARFELIVLKPILSKINRAFVDCDEDYVDTLQLFFYIESIEGDISNYEASIADVYICNSTLNEYCTSWKSMKVLFHFIDVLEKHIESEKEIIESIFSNCRDSAYNAFECMYVDKSDYITFKSLNNYNYDEVCAQAVDELLWVFIVGMIRYEELCSYESSKNVEFDQFLFSF